MSAYRFNELQMGAVADAFVVDEALVMNVNFQSPHDWVIDTPIRFQVKSPLAGTTDMPLVTLPATILSRRIADLLLGLGGFEVSVYEIQLESMSGEPVGSPGDFVIFHVRTFLDVLDRESARLHTFNLPGLAADGHFLVRSLALLEPSGGLPDLFPRASRDELRTHPEPRRP